MPNHRRDLVPQGPYLGAIIDRVEVDDHQIRIRSRKDVLEQAVLAEGGRIRGVRSFVRG
jgi:hypothetical protein